MITKQVRSWKSTYQSSCDSLVIAGVECEEAAGKHRAGDPAKSMRFFERAINTYDEGIGKFPASFDLAYNKARVQYEVAIHPKLVKQLQRPLLGVLREALASHEHALSINENDADLLFNTSQLLTSIAEELANGGSSGEAIGSLQLALQLQSRCLSVQEWQYSESFKQQREAQELFDKMTTGADLEQDAVPRSDEPETSPTSDQWASVVEPVTAETLADTILACFGTMTTLCTTLTSSDDQLESKIFAELENDSTQLLEKVQTLPISAPENLHELALADAILKSALFDAAFAYSELDAPKYAQLLSNTWSINSMHLNLQLNYDALLAHADALISFNSSLSSPDAESNLRWEALSSALNSLTIASKLPNISAEERVKTHFIRGDICLLKYQLSKPPHANKQAAANSDTLLKNATVFYRNAVQLSTDPDARDQALFRYDVAEKTRDGTIAKRLPDLERNAAEALQEMISEGLLSTD